MKGKLFCWLAALAIVACPLTARAETTDELSSTKSLTRTRLGLYFDEESLRNCSTNNAFNGKEISCKLDPQPNHQGKRRVHMVIFAAPGGPVAVEGDLEFNYPLDIRFSSRGEHRYPFLQLEPNALKGLTYTVTKFSLPGPYGTELSATRGTLVMRGNTVLRDDNQRSSGTLDFESPLFTLSRVRVGLPNTDLAQPMLMRAEGPILARLHLQSLRTEVRQGSLVASGLSFAGPQTMSANGLAFSIDAKPTVAGVRVQFANGAATVSISKLTASPRQVSYKTSTVAFDATAIKRLLIGKLLYAVPAGSTDLEMSRTGTKLEDLICTGNLTVSSLAGASVVGGAGTIRVARLYSSELSGNVDLSSISSLPQFGPGLTIKPTALSLQFSQQGSNNLQVKGTTRLTEFVMGTMRFSELSGPVNFQTRPAAAGLDLSAKALGAVIRIEDPQNKIVGKSGALSGSGQISVLRGRVLNVLSPDRQLVVDKGDWQFGISAPEVGTTLSGGALSVGAPALNFTNEQLLVSVQDGIKGTFASKGVPMSAPAINVLPNTAGHSIRIGAATLSAGAAFFTIDPDAASKAPFGLSGSFVAKDLKARFSPAMPLRANDLEFLTSEVAIHKITLTVSLVKANVRIEGFSVTADTFGTTNKDSTESPAISGQLAAPFSIPLAEGDLPYTAPIALYNLKVRDVKLALKNVQYKSPDGGAISTPSVVLQVPELGDDTIDASFEVADGDYRGPLAPPDSGTLEAKIKHARLEVKGPRKPLKGSLDLDIGSLRAKGVLTWYPLENCCGDIGDANAANPGFTVPLQLDAVVPKLSGRINFDGDLVGGGLRSVGASVVTAAYVGPVREASWTHDWLFQAETLWKSDYPCLGSISDPVRTCHAWGVLLPKIEGHLNWHFKLNAIVLNGGLVDYAVIPKMDDKEFTCTPDPATCPGGTVTRRVAVGVKQCGGHLTALQPALLLTAIRIYPDIINADGDIAKVINAGWGKVIGLGESASVTVVARIATDFGPLFTVFKGC
jgi:hypothetical protein